MQAFDALGLNAPALLFNASAFLVFVWLLSKFVFPVLTRAIDTKREELITTSQLKLEAELALEKAGQAGDKVLAEARKQADAALVVAHSQAANLIKQAQDKAETEAKRIIDQAQVQLNSNLAQAREQLKGDLTRLVAAETEALLGGQLSASLDAKLIAQQLEGASD